MWILKGAPTEHADASAIDVSKFGQMSAGCATVQGYEIFYNSHVYYTNSGNYCYFSVFFSLRFGLFRIRNRNRVLRAGFSRAPSVCYCPLQLALYVNDNFLIC